MHQNVNSELVAYFIYSLSSLTRYENAMHYKEKRSVSLNQFSSVRGKRKIIVWNIHCMEA